MLMHSLQIFAVMALIPLVFMAGSAQASSKPVEKAITVQTQPEKVKSLLLAKGQNNLPSRNNKDHTC